ncbi:MAG: DUF3592 domain-containing protein [Marinoscillum sp.]
MIISEQLRRIVIVAPKFPIQLTATIVMLIVTGVLGYKAFDVHCANWTEGTAELIDFTDVQGRTREGKPDYFYKLHYKFRVNNQEYQVKRERSFHTSEMALETLNEDVKIDLSPVWYSSWNPNKSTMEEDDTKWYYFLFGLIPAILTLIYLKWLFLKYYELEIEK